MIQPSAHSVPCLEALEPRLAPAGIVAVNVKGGVLSITGDSDGENNNVEIYDAGNGLWGIRDGGGAGTTFSLNGADDLAEVTVSVSGGVKIDLKGGDDILTFDGVKIGGPITLKDTAGNDDVFFYNTVVNGTVKLDTGNGNDEIFVTGSTFNNTITVKTGAGDDRVDFYRGTYRSITTDLGTGFNTFAVADSQDGGSIKVFGNISVVNKGEATFLSSIAFGSEDFLVTGTVKVKASQGYSSLMLSNFDPGGSFLINGGFSYVGGNGTDQITLEDNITIAGKADFKTGKGDSTLDTDNLGILTLGSLSYTGGSGVNDVELNGATVNIGGDALFNLAAGSDNKVTFNSSVNAFIAGKLTYKGGKGDDVLDVNAPDFQALGALSFTVGAGFYSSLGIKSATGILGSVTMKGGTGLDAVQLGDLNDDATESLQILGKVNVNLGKTASNEFFISDTTIYGAVTITGNTNAPDLGNAYQSIGIGDSTFLSSLVIKTSGTEGAEIGLSNSTFLAAVNITTGNGNDVVHLDSNLAPYGDGEAKNIFDGPVKILLGSGDDFIRAGVLAGAADEGNIFNGTVFLDGGAGEDLDSVAPIFGNVFNDTLTKKNFETPLV